GGRVRGRPRRGGDRRRPRPLPRPRRAAVSSGRDFTLAKYDEVCRALVESGYPSIAIAEYVAQRRMSGPPTGGPDSFVLPPHDVETSSAPAVALAAGEAPPPPAAADLPPPPA